MSIFEYAYSGRIYRFIQTGEDQVNLTAFAKDPNNPKPIGLTGLKLGDWLKGLVKKDPSLKGQFKVIRGTKNQGVSFEIARRYVQAAVGVEEGASEFKFTVDEETKGYFDGLINRLGQQIGEIGKQLGEIGKTVLDHAERLVRGEQRMNAHEQRMNVHEQRIDAHDAAIGTLKGSQDQVRDEQEKIKDTFAEQQLRMDQLERQLREEREARERQERIWEERFKKATKRGPFGL